MEDREVWAEVPDFDEYLVSSHGQVYNMRRKVILNFREHTTAGYLKVRLTNGWETKEFYVHHLVGICFFEEDVYRAGMHIRHIDEDKTNNHVDNLEPAKTRRVGKNAHQPKHIRGSKVRIIETGEIFLNAYACARYVDGDVSSIYKCLRGDRNRHMGRTYEYV